MSVKISSLNTASTIDSGDDINIAGNNPLTFSDWGGGWFMQDGTYIRSLNQKSIWLGDGVLASNGGLSVGYGGALPTAGYAIIAGALLIGTTSTTNTSAGKIVNRLGGTSNPDLVLNGGAWSIASIGGEPALYLSSNIVAATGIPGATQTAKGGMGFEYSSATSPTDLVLGIFGTPTVASSVKFFNNTERMRITSGGNVYIGHTDDYGARFSVKQPASGNAANFSNGSDADLNIEITATGAATKYAKLTPSVAIPLVLSTTAGSNVGVGLTNPNGKLTVKETDTNWELNTSTDGVQQLAYNRTTSAYKYMEFRGSDFRFSPSDVEKVRINSSGDFLVGTTSSIWGTSNRGIIQLNGTSQALIGLSIGGASKAYLFHQGTNLSVWNEANGKIEFGTNNTLRLTIEAGGNVLIGSTTDAGYKLYVTGKGLFDGVVNSYATMDNLARRINSPEGASYVTSTSSVTGAIKIKLPVARNNSATMMMFTVKLYQYNTGNCHEFQIAGYNYNLGGWYNPSVTDLTDNGSNFNVRFGTDATSDCVWIGETNSGWVYPQVFVTDFQAGYNGQGIEWATGWAISFETSFDTVEQTRLASQVITSRSIGAQSVNYAVSAGTAGALSSMNISQFTNDSGYITSSALSGYALVNHTHDLGRYSLQAPAYIDGLTTTNFRNTLFGNTSNTFNISTARWNTTPTALSGLNSYGTMLAWSGADTQGFIAVDYYSTNAKIGGGNASNINWSALLLHSSNYSSYALPLSGGNLTGLVQSTANIEATAFRTDGNFELTSGLTGLKSNFYDTRFYANSVSSWVVSTTAASTGGSLEFRQGFGSTIKGYVYWDASGFGLLNNIGGWSVRTNNGSNYGGTLFGNWVVRSMNVDSGSIIFYTSAGVTKGSVTWDDQGFGLINNQGDYSVLCNQGSSYGGLLRGTWTSIGNFNIIGAELSINSNATSTYSKITYRSSLDPNSYDWYTGMNYDPTAEETYYYIRYIDGNQFRVYPDGTIYINGGAFSQYSATGNYISVAGFGLYSANYSSYIRTNTTTSSYGAWDVTGAKGGYTGFVYNTMNLPHVMFDVSNGNGGLYYQTGSRWVLYYSYGNNSLGIGGTTTDATYKLYVNGNVRVVGTFNLSTLITNGAVYSIGGGLTNTNPSDLRLKEDIAPLQYGLKEVMALNPVTYKWKDGSNGGQRSTGLIAQDVKEVMPEYVSNISEDDDYLGLDSYAINIVLINAIKELKAEIEILKNK